MKLAWENSDSQPAGASDMPKPVIVQEQATHDTGPDFTPDEMVMREPVHETDKVSGDYTDYLRTRIIRPKRDKDGHMLLIQTRDMAKHLKKNHKPEYDLQKSAFVNGVESACTTYGI